MPPIKVNLDDGWSKDILGHYSENPEKKTPFDFYLFPDLLDKDSLNKLRDDIKSSIKVKSKDNDLYKFRQSKDLRTDIKSDKLTPTIISFIDTMLDDVRLRLERSTGLKLSKEHFDITVSRYDKGNYLLCHNDDIKDEARQHRRALAFIYYMNTRSWTAEDGGSLAIFDSDQSGEPIHINNRIYPKPNMLAVFRTGSKSWHSVEEVVCQDDTRLSVNGWFHIDESKSIDDSTEQAIEACPYTFHRPICLDDRLEKFFKEYINPDYLMEKTCFMIRKKFKRNSEINLINFLVKEKYQEISLALSEASRKREDMVRVGPYNKRNYLRMKLDDLPAVCKDLFDAFKSELFFMLLSRLTGLDLQPPSLASEVSKEHQDEEDDDSEEDSDDDDDDDDDDEEEDDDEDDDSDEDDNVEDNEGGDNVTIEEDPTTNGDDVRPSDPTTKGSILETMTKRNDQPSTSVSQDKIKAPPKKRKRVSDPLARAEFRHFESGSYTVIHDYDYELGEASALDVLLHFNHDFDVDFDNGGYISYLDASNEDDMHDMECELLTIEPKSNCLSLAYRCDLGTCRFLKYISKSHKSSYQDLSCVYYERPDDLPNTGKDVKIDTSQKA